MAQIAVLGAGMVGVSTALALQDHGHDCVIVDRSPPGSETSHGNAGIIQAEAVEPYALPTSPLTLLRMAFGWKNAVDLDWASLPGQMPALHAYWRSSLPDALRRVIPVWRQLVSEAIPHHAALIAAAGADHLIRKDGYWEVHGTDAPLAAAVLEAERRKRLHGTDFTVVDGAALSRAEPGLRTAMAGAIHWTTPWTCRAPGDLVRAYAALFEERGGRIVAGDAATLGPSGLGWRVAGESVEHAVVALGPWSPDLLKTLGYHVPMVRKRGYHRHYDGNHGLSRPMLLADHSVVLSPMLTGLRVATAAELSAAAPRSNPRQLARGEVAARTLVDLGDPVESSPWSGTRPCLPGLLPLVCQAKRHRGLWLHFGHGHQGFTLGPATAARLARAIDGDAGAVGGLDAGIA
ncbi:FAD-binding oxidoreductase [Azospirillum sp. RWY-5-1]|uniref:FAD-binding oxidoreductase n=1 Tax=Azospirillum oleiclasticum TaxID=2735135 RepID=A0ABX2TJ25_9PROT|nr:FAD-dependent oxidoreductase [Azospirillum oleiclasticum]NYZ14578.1 FAD-binding oxidoreductase [Azospirillum oleiclasticum]NYZ24356.1 FAD-binding oxidoreductase [Azospirillum oleiclasticum]